MPPAYGAQPPVPPYYAPQAARKGPNPVGAAGFILSLISLLLFVVGIIALVAWGVNFGVSLVNELREEGYTTEQEVQQYIRQHQQEMERRMEREMGGKIVLTWVAMGVGVLGLVLSIVGMTRKNARKGLAIAGLVMGLLVAVCAMGSAVSSLASMFVKA
jgi:uncharacterized BrkB/YihY/UPF0761 family membrane protein